ncbi:MAG: extracellular solute-binding protein [Deltaproteobacteria bacterium]|nr:extracellular solute-binding protein [Deltaproteobacteria bacterium]
MSAARVSLLRALLVLAALLPLPWRQAIAAQVDEIVLWHAYQGREEAGLEAAARTWTEQSGVRVKLVAIPFGAFASKVETAIPRGNGPDLFIAAHDSIGKWSAMGVVEPTPQLSADGLRPELMEAVRWGDQRWGLPLAYKSLVLLYDPTVIQTPPTTTDALIAEAHKYTGGGRYGLAYQASETYYHAPWAHAFGATPFDAEGRLVPLDSDAHVKAYAFTARIARDEGIVPQQPTYESVQRLYNEGNAVFVIAGPWFVSDVDRPIAAAPLPWVSDAGAPARPFLTVDVAYVAGQAQHPDEASAFTTWLAGPEGARIRQEQGGQAVSSALVPTDDPLLKTLEVQSKTALLMPMNPGLQGLWESEAKALRRVMRGAATPSQAAHEAALYWEVVSRPSPPAVSPWPYVVVMVAVLLGALGWLLAPLRDPDFRAKLRRHAWDYVWIGPATVAMVLLVLTPFVVGAGVAFFAHDQGEFTFIGLRHFTDILFARDWPLSSPLSFFYTLGVTLLWTVTNLIVHVGLGIALALILREPWIRMRAGWRAALILPWAVPNYITALIWRSMFHVQDGAINALITLVSGAKDPVQIDWFGSFVTSFGANLITNGWLGFPFMMVVTLGALQSIPRDLEEAAEVDGASWAFRFRHVVWPLLKPALLPAVILGSVWTFNAFNIIYLVSAGEPDGTTEILISEAYRWAFTRGNRYGYAAAYALIIFGVLLAYSRAANRLVGRKVL